MPRTSGTSLEPAFIVRQAHALMPSNSDSTTEPNRRVRVKLPPWLAGNDVLQFTQDAALKPTAVDASRFEWALETLESYEHRTPGLVRVETLATPGFAPNWGALAAIPDPGINPTVPLEQLIAERERILAERPGNFTALIAALSVVLASVPHAHLAQATQDGYDTLAGLQLEADRGAAFPDLTARFIEFHPALMKRLALARVLMRIEEEPELLKTRPSPAPGTTAFGSGWHLTADLALTRDAYLAPLFLAASPWLWCFAFPRLPGVIQIDLGLAIVGRRGEASELLQSFFPPGVPTSVPRPALSGANTRVTTEWWIAHLDQLLSHLTDFANFCDMSGAFVPRRLFEIIMSVEQLGRRIQGIFVHDRDVSTRNALTFDAFDTLQGLAITNLYEGCKLSRATATLARLEQAIPGDVSSLLLPAARRAVDALQRMQQGFFLPSRTDGKTVRLPDRKGVDQERPIEEAVALYLKVLRNANHGFTPEQDANERRDQILLMAHDGDVPADIAFLPYIYWLDVLANPETLKGRLRPRSRVGAALN